VLNRKERVDMDVANVRCAVAIEIDAQEPSF
jgi:hypothetical protein